MGAEQKFREDRLPPDLPDSQGLRTVADYLEFLMPASASLALVQTKDYTGIHELAGVHETISTIRQWADEMDEINRLQEATEGSSP